MHVRPTGMHKHCVLMKIFWQDFPYFELYLNSAIREEHWRKIEEISQAIQEGRIDKPNYPFSVTNAFETWYRPIIFDQQRIEERARWLAQQMQIIGGEFTSERYLQPWIHAKEWISDIQRDLNQIDANIYDLNSEQVECLQQQLDRIRDILEWEMMNKTP